MYSFYLLSFNQLHATYSLNSLLTSIITPYFIFLLNHSLLSLSSLLSLNSLPFAALSLCAALLLCTAPLPLCGPSSSLWPLYLAPGGESGIRTRDTLLRYTHFPGALLKPLGHLSNTRQHIPHKKGVILPSQWPSAPRCRLCINPLTLKVG